MNQLAFVTLFCIVAAYSFSGVSAQSTDTLMCYNCTHVVIASFEAGDTNCKDPFMAAGISKVPCDGSCTVRRLEGDIPTVQRTCHTAAEGECVDLKKYELSPGNYVSQYCCSGQLCNSAGATTFNLFVIALAAMVGSLVKF